MKNQCPFLDEEYGECMGAECMLYNDRNRDCVFNTMIEKQIEIVKRLDSIESNTSYIDNNSLSANVEAIMLMLKELLSNKTS